MINTALFVLRRAFVYAVVTSIAATAFIVVAIEFGGEGTGRSVPEALLVAGLCAAGLTVVVFGVNTVAGIGHVRRLRTDGFEPTAENLAVTHTAEVDMRAEPDQAFRAAVRTLKDLSRARIVADDRGTLTARAVRRVPENRGFAQVITVHVTGGAGRSTVRVHSRARFHLAVFDMGESRRNVGEVTGELPLNLQ